VGASLLAMVSRALRLTSKHALSLTTIASKLAPTTATTTTTIALFRKPGLTGIKTSGQAFLRQSNQIDLDVDIAAGRFGVRASLMRQFYHVACDGRVQARQADIQAGL